MPTASASESRAGSPMNQRPDTPNAGSEGPAESRLLNVTGALSYLDAVKVQFQDNPDVYNHFLDTMRDFRSQVIDTPCVIERVSMLFHGNPDLIQGFNTFMPPGYRIDISADPRDPNLITITTPMGITTQNTNTFGQHLRPTGLLPPRLFVCDGCNKTFARMHALNRHLRSEGGADCQKILHETQDDGQTQDDDSGVQPKQDDLTGRPAYPSPHASPRYNLEELPESATRIDASPGAIDLTDKISREGQYPCAHGGFADVWKGIWSDARGAHLVAIKVLRAPMDDPVKQLKLQTRLRRELCVWQRLKHENVLVLYGTAANFGQYPSFVCPWLENGNISKYLKKRADDLGMAGRLQLLCEVAAGLSYLHASGVVHGDLTGANILITDDGSACLCDFGLSSIAAEFQGTSYITSTMSGNIRWAAPELYNVAEDGAVPMVSTHSDAYSYGSVAFEILSGQVPFANLRDAQVFTEVFKGKKTRRPQDAPYVTDQLWAFMNQCWAETPTARPCAEQLLQSIQRFLNEIG